MDEKPIKTTVEELKNLIKIDNYIGETIETDDKILIPVSKVALGFGIGENSKNTLAGSGAGVSIEPTSMLVISKGVKGIEGIRVLSLSKKSEKNKLIEDLGLIVTDIVKEVLSTKDQKISTEEHPTETNTENLNIIDEE